MGCKIEEFQQEQRKRMRSVQDSMDVLNGKWKIPIISSICCYGKRRFSDILNDVEGISNRMLSKELKELERQLDSFHYLPAFSREEPKEGRRTGYVHAVYEELLHEQKPDAKFYLCGWKAMIDEAKQRITALGYDRKDIHLELYG